MKSKNPGLSARTSSIEAALSVSAPESTPDGKEPIVPLSLRLPKSVHARLDALAYESRRTEGATRLTIHGIIMEGIAMYLSQHDAGSK